MQERKEEYNRAVYDCLFAAAANGRIDDIKRLLKRGVKVDRTIMDEEKHKGRTALFCAAQGNHMEVRSDEERRM